MELDLDRIILKKLAELPPTHARKSKALAEDLEGLIAPKQLSVKLRTLRKLGYVERILKDDWWMHDTYPAGYWKITNRGRFMIAE